MSEQMTGMQRLQRVLAARGIASRRKAEALIQAGRVSVDGQIVRELGVRVDPERQDIRVDGRPLPVARPRYIMLHKPVGYITTTADERGRQTVLDLVDVPERVVPVGRLDRDTSGLLLLTNDGEFLYRITHPRYELEKEYEVLVDGFPDEETIALLRRGVSIAGRPVAVRRVLLLRTEPQGAVFDVVVHEGRNRIIRRMFERVGYPVLALKRTRIGPLELGALPVGAWRDLTPDEVAALARVVDLDRQIVRDEPRRFNARPRQAEMARGRSDGAKRSAKGAATVPDRYRNRRSSRSGEKHRPR